MKKINLPEFIKISPTIMDLVNRRETLYINPKIKNTAKALENATLKLQDIEEAERCLKRFAPYIRLVFPQTESSFGIIESPLINAEKYQKYFKTLYKTDAKILIKCDNQLPISGSIKARGGIYEVLFYAEKLAFENNLLSINDDYSILNSEKFKKFFANHSLSVASTGNLGLSVGIMGATLGFKTTVHMSCDAKAWKKALLRERGASVIEYDGDYSMAVEMGRSSTGVGAHFVDDENSQTLFIGYATAALRLKTQLDEMGITVDSTHPLFVYLPCGVGGAPGGITFGLKCLFGDDVHCFFGESVNAPCMILGMASGLQNKICVQDLGLDGKTIADGLAVGRSSGFVGKFIEPILNGLYTVDDEKLLPCLAILSDIENIKIEPSATVGFFGIHALYGTQIGHEYLAELNIEKAENITHVVWATGGEMVPKTIMDEYYKIGKAYNLK